MPDISILVRTLQQSRRLTGWERALAALHPLMLHPGGRHEHLARSPAVVALLPNINATAIVRPDLAHLPACHRYLYGIALL